MKKKEEIKMMEFVILTLSFTVAILLASALSVVIMLNSKVTKWYMKKINNMTAKMFEESFAADKES
jgi:type IV secretory pathway component VirB8